MRQPLLKQQQVAADVNGNVTFKFEYVPMSLTWVVSFNVAHSPPAAQWSVNVGDGLDYGTWHGLTTYGPVRVGQMMQSQVLGVGLQPGTTYNCQMVGFSTDEYIDPIPPSSGIISTHSIEASIPIVTNKTFTIGNIGSRNDTYPLPPGVRYLTIYVSAAPVGAAGNGPQIQIQDRITSPLFVTPNPVVYGAFWLPDDSIPRIFYVPINPILAANGQAAFTVAMRGTTAGSGDSVVYSIVGSQSNPTNQLGSPTTYSETNTNGVTLIPAASSSAIARVWATWCSGENNGGAAAGEVNISGNAGAFPIGPKALVPLTPAGTGSSVNAEMTYPNGLPLPPAILPITSGISASLLSGFAGIAYSWDRLF